MVGQISQLGRTLWRLADEFGQFVCFCGSVLGWMVKDVVKARRWRLVLPQFYEVGTRSIPVVMIVGGFIGMVLAVEAYDQFAAIGQESRLGNVINISVVKQIGPVLAAVMLAGRVGGAFAAELGTMTVTEQVDALRVMASHPISYLVVPRVLACIVMIPILTVVSDLLGMFGGWFITVQVFGVNSQVYWQNSASFVGTWDISTGLIKSVFFGLAIGLISCYKGFYCQRGAQGVGRAATDAFVTSFIAIIVLNFFLATFAKDLYTIIFGYGGVTAFG